jgi:hypothetical protein
VQKVAERFGIDRGPVPYRRDGGRERAPSRNASAAGAYANAVEQVRNLGDGAMANVTGADLVPVGILADDIDDAATPRRSVTRSRRERCHEQMKRVGSNAP